MRKPVSILAPLAVAALLAACDSSPQVQAVPVQRAPDAVTHEVARPAVIGEVAAVEQPAQAEPPAPESELRAQLLGINKKKAEVEEASAQVEPDEAAKPVRRRRVKRAQPRDEDPEPAGAVISLSDFEFQDTVNGWRGIQGCIAMNAGHYQDRSGALRVSFDIAADGAVKDCKVVDSSNAVARAISSCVERKARRLRFPAFEGDNVTKVAKFVF